MNLTSFFGRIREKGNTLVLFAITVPVLVGMTGLVLDWGMGVWTRTELQRAADAGALAGCHWLDDETMADFKARELVNSNFDGCDSITCSANLVDETFTVELTEDVPTMFMRIFGRDTMHVRVDATAIAPMEIGGLRAHIWPFGLINPDFNNDPCDDLTSANYGTPIIIGYGEPNTMVEHWSNGTCSPVPPAPAGNKSANGWRGALSLGASGGNTLKQNMIFGYEGDIQIGDTVLTETGNMDGPFSQGREQRLGLEPSLWQDFDPEYDKYDSRVVLVPIVHLINVNRQDEYTSQDYLNGAKWDNGRAVVDGFAPFWILTEEEQGDVNGDGNPNNDGDWIVGYFIPGINVNDYLHPDPVPNPEDWGIRSTPRLID
ncbi:MAG TPA: Tad domain-containing protein [bacterium]|jgi:hypothetical protein